VTDANVEGLGLKAVVKNRLLRLLSSQKVHPGALLDSAIPACCSSSMLQQLDSSAPRARGDASPSCCG
jgi:hypothetical protein